MKDHTKNNLFENLHAFGGVKIITKSVSGTKLIALLKKQGEPESNNRSYPRGILIAFEYTNTVPNIITMSKGIGGNGYPLLLILYKKEFDVWESGTHIGTFRGNQIAMAAGKAAL